MHNDICMVTYMPGNYSNILSYYRIEDKDSRLYCTFTKFNYLINFTIFTDPEDVLNLFCMKYYEIDINQYIGINATSVKLNLYKYFKIS